MDTHEPVPADSTQTAELNHRWWEKVRNGYPGAWRAIAPIGIAINLAVIPVDLLNMTGPHLRLIIALRSAAALWFVLMYAVARWCPDLLKRWWLTTLLMSFVFFSLTFTVISLLVDGVSNHYYAAIIETEFVVAAFGLMPVLPFAAATILLNAFYIVSHQAAGLIADSSELLTLTATLGACATIAIATLHRMIRIQISGFAELCEREALSRELEDRVAAQTLRLQRLNTFLNDQIESHRRKLSRELHDDLGQLLSIIVQTANALQASADRLHDRDRERLMLLNEVSGKAVEAVRRLAAENSSPALAERDLAAAIRADVRRIEASGALSVGCAIESVPRLDEATALAIYRIFQEATSNTLRHADATVLQIFLGASDAMLMLSVRDNGRGFDPRRQDSDSGVGLDLMQQRAWTIGATLDIESAPGRGTNITLRVPLSPAATTPGERT